MSRLQFCTTYLLGVELDTGLDDIDGGKGGVGNGAANSSSGSSLKEVHKIVLVEVIDLRGGRSQKNGTGGSRSRHGSGIRVVLEGN